MITTYKDYLDDQYVLEATWNYSHMEVAEDNPSWKPWTAESTLKKYRNYMKEIRYTPDDPVAKVNKFDVGLSLEEEMEADRQRKKRRCLGVGEHRPTVTFQAEVSVGGTDPPEMDLAETDNINSNIRNEPTVRRLSLTTAGPRRSRREWCRKSRGYKPGQWSSPSGYEKVETSWSNHNLFDIYPKSNASDDEDATTVPVADPSDTLNTPTPEFISPSTPKENTESATPNENIESATLLGNKPSADSTVPETNSSLRLDTGFSTQEIGSSAQQIGYSPPMETVSLSNPETGSSCNSEEAIDPMTVPIMDPVSTFYIPIPVENSPEQPDTMDTNANLNVAFVAPGDTALPSSEVTESSESSNSAELEVFDADTTISNLPSEEAETSDSEVRTTKHSGRRNKERESPIGRRSTRSSETNPDKVIGSRVQKRATTTRVDEAKRRTLENLSLTGEDITQPSAEMNSAETNPTTVWKPNFEGAILAVGSALWAVVELKRYLGH